MHTTLQNITILLAFTVFLNVFHFYFLFWRHVVYIQVMHILQNRDRYRSKALYFVWGYHDDDDNNDDDDDGNDDDDDVYDDA